MRRPPRATFLLLLALTCSAPDHRMQAGDCSRLFDRLVALELEELGYRDGALEQLKQRQLRPAFAADLARCEGLQRRADALDCTARAHTVEEAVHGCLGDSR